MSDKTSTIKRWEGDAMLAYTMPLFVFVVVGFGLAALVEVLPFVENFSDSPWYYKDPDQWIKPAQVVAGSGTMYFFRRNYIRRDWNFSVKNTLWGIFAGAVGIGFWLLPTTLYDYWELSLKYEKAPSWFTWLGLEARMEGYNVDVFDGNVVAQSVAVFLRFVYACVVVSLVEEICWRGFAMRAAVDWDRWQDQDFGVASWKTFIVPTVLFISIHQPVDYFGALVYGSLTWFVVIRTKSLSSAVIMHGVANLLMGIYALVYGKYGLW